MTGSKEIDGRILRGRPEDRGWHHLPAVLHGPLSKVLKDALYEEWSKTLTDIVDVFYVEELKMLWLGCAEKAVLTEVRKRLAPDASLSSLNPGSLLKWPIEGQRELFRILGDTEGSVGVRLTESCLMLPSKSGSGILFQDHTGHVNCAFCPRESCPNRRVPFRANME